MDEALELARQGLGRTSPNPTVGALLVKDGQIVGRGFHTYAQTKHAEVVALEDSVALDIFNPPRQDWIDGDDAYLRAEPQSSSE